MGIPWAKQRFRNGDNTALVLDRVRQEILTGQFDTRTWDHNHPRRRSAAHSNKQVRMAAFHLTGDERLIPQDDKAMQLAWDIVLRTVLGLPVVPPRQDPPMRQ